MSGMCIHYFLTYLALCLVIILLTSVKFGDHGTNSWEAKWESEEASA